MTKFQKVQKISSIIPFWSTVFVAIVTMFELKRRAASKKIWLYFLLTFFLFWTAAYFLNTVVMTGQHPILNVIATGLLLSVANILFVDFQVMSIKTQQQKVSKTSKAGIVYCVGVVIIILMLFSPVLDIEDINGPENTNLAVIDRNEFLLSTDQYSAISSYTSQTGCSTKVDGKLKDYDYQECSFRCKEISGITTLQATKTANNQLTLEISSKLEKGNMEIMIIIDGEYYAHVPINQNYSIELTNITDKTVIVKIGAESAKLSVVVKRFME